MTPNLFIVGAPKCGTTALATWLSSHPEVFVSPVKEPHYFCTEFQLTPSLEQYESMFVGANNQHRWRCEASVWYLYSPVAVPNILKHCPNAKFIVMVRNPVDMVPSMHRNQGFNGIERVEDLDAALDLNDRRLAGHADGMAKDYPPDHLAYFHSCALGWQVQRLIALVPPGQLHIVVYDDLKADVAAMYRDVLAFLGVGDFVPPGFERINVAKVRRYRLLDRAARALGKWKAEQGIELRFGLLAALRKWNQREVKVEPLPAATRMRLIEGFRPDVAELEGCLGRDLSHWLR